MDELSSLLALAGVNKNHSEYKTIGLSGNDKARIMKEQNIKPGTKEWFILWRHNPITGPNPYEGY